MITKCEWILESGERCGKKPVEERSFCHIHLKSQQVALRNVENLPAGAVTKSVLEQKTEKANQRSEGEGALVVMGGSPDASYKFVRNTNTKRNDARAGNWRKLIVACNTEGRPSVGQTETMHTEYKDQVNSKGEIECGDLVLYWKPREEHRRNKAASAERSNRLARRIANHGADAQLQQATGNDPNFFTSKQRPEGFPVVNPNDHIIDTYNPQPSTKKHFVISNNPLAR